MTFKETLLDIAKSAIKDKLFGTNTLISKEKAVELCPIFEEKKATFVTLNKNNNLRGCIGSLVAHQDLYDDLVHNAISAAFGDPRFNPLSEDEIDQVDIEVSILTTPTRVDYVDKEDLKTKIVPQVDGVILRLGSYQATFLPQVWDSLSDFETFFAHLCQKARLLPNCLDNHPEIFKYQVKKYK